MGAKYDPILGKLREKDAGGGGGGGDISISDVTGLQSALEARATLDDNGRIPEGQLARTVTEIPSATAAKTLADGGFYVHAPASAPVYTLPSVTGTATGRTHEIIVRVDFTTVQSCAFVDSSNTTIVPLDALTILAGDVVEYLCSYDALQSKWVIAAGYIKARS